MGLARLKMHKFNSAEELCNFVNDNGISVIESIAVCENRYQIFYR